MLGISTIELTLAMNKWIDVINRCSEIVNNLLGFSSEGDSELSQVVYKLSQGLHQSFIEAYRDIFDIIIRHISRRLTDLIALQESLSSADQKRMHAGQMKLAIYLDCLVAIRVDRVVFVDAKLLATSAEAVDVLAILESVAPMSLTMQVSDAIKEWAISTANRLARYL